MRETHAFRLVNDLAEVPPLRERFAGDCDLCGVLEEDKQAMMLAFTELVNNAIEHGCCAPDDYVEGWYSITKNDIEIEVSDRGEVLSEEDFKNSDPTDFAETGRGAGLFLIQAVTDEIRVSPGASGGTTVRVIKHRRQAAS
jgi:anti-sigma regulatory factor (Ser/Thr protein kinase)